jgi:hypothetical protein
MTFGTLKRITGGIQKNVYVMCGFRNATRSSFKEVSGIVFGSVVEP